MTFQVTASLLQPLIGMYTDKRPLPYSLPVGMGVIAGRPDRAGLCRTITGVLLVGAALIGLGSAVFHPESSRVARLASGGRYGLAQSLFQVGGNVGQAIGPLLAAFIVVPTARGSIAWFSLAALLGMVDPVAGRQLVQQPSHGQCRTGRRRRRSPCSPAARIAVALVVLAVLTFSKNIYMASIVELLHLLC